MAQSGSSPFAITAPTSSETAAASILRQRRERLCRVRILRIRRDGRLERGPGQIATTASLEREAEIVVRNRYARERWILRHGGELFLVHRDAIGPPLASSIEATRRAVR